MPCARCARGVDPLRAAAVRATDDGIRYFCSVSCRSEHARSEAALRGERAPPPAPARRQGSPAPVHPGTLVPVSQRIPARPPPRAGIWAPIAALACGGAGFLPYPAAPGLSALLLGVLAALLATQAASSRAAGGAGAWLLPPLATLLAAFSTLWSASPAVLPVAALGAVATWLRERLLAAEDAAHAARAEEQLARLARRVTVLVPALDPERTGAREIAQERPSSGVRPGDVLRIEAGTVLPVDGVIVGGTAEILAYPEAARPAIRGEGAVVLAGALIARGTLRIQATRVGRERTLLRPYVASQAHALTPHGHRAALVLAHAGAATLVTLLSAGGLDALDATALGGLAGALLCAPALALARGTGASLRAAETHAVSRGVAFRDLGAIDAASRADAVALRVEGVLVERTYALADVVPIGEGHDARALLALVLAAELSAGAHPLALAVRAHPLAEGLALPSLRRVAYTKGCGITGLTERDGELVLGSRAALLAAGVSVAVADAEAERLEREGHKVVFLALGDHVRGLLVFEHALRPEAPEALRALLELGLELTLLASDHRASVEAVTRPLAVESLAAELSAAQRAREVTRLREGDARVVAVGRLPEDEALLAAADTAICVGEAGASGHAVATASADLREVSAALTLARRTRRCLSAITLLAAVVLTCALLAAARVLPALLAGVVGLTVEWVAVVLAPRLLGRRLDVRRAERPKAH